MSSNQHGNDFDDFGDIGEEVEKYLRDIGVDDTPNAEQPKRSERSKHVRDEMDQLQYSAAYEEVKKALEGVFDMCERHGFSIQVALSDSPLNGAGEQGQRITICGHLTPHNVPCEMVAAAAVYQSNHIFSHMVIAMASAGAPLINPFDDDDDDDDADGDDASS